MDRNHSHFVLVKNSLKNWGGEIDFRNNLELELSQTSKNKSKNNIIIQILIIRGIYSLIHIFLNFKVPTILIGKHFSLIPNIL